MKQTKVLRTALIAVLALVLLCSLVACNKDKTDPDGSTPELSAEMKQLIEDSRADIDAAFNWFLSNAEQIKVDGDKGVDMHITCYGRDDRGPYIVVGVSLYGLYGYGPGAVDPPTIEIYPNEERAQARYEDIEYKDGVRVDGCKIIMGDGYEEMLSYKRPENITVFNSDVMAFMQSKLHRGAAKNEGMTETTFYYDSSDNIVEADTITSPARGVCLTLEGIANDFESEDPIEDFSSGIPEFMDINYTSDSYIRVNKDTGYCSYKLTYKTGWSLRRDYEGKYFTEYWCNDLPSSLTLPSNIGGYDIEKAELSLYNEYGGYVEGTIDHFIIEKEIDSVYINYNIKEIDIPLSNKAFVDMDDNSALEKINFAGTMQQWRDLYGERAQEWVHVYDHWDEETDESVYVDISFKVVCKDGTINYPEA